MGDGFRNFRAQMVCRQPASRVWGPPPIHVTIHVEGSVALNSRTRSNQTMGPYRTSEFDPFWLRCLLDSELIPPDHDH